MAAAAFRRIVHCDWSKNPPGRWMATVRCEGGGWSADGPVRVPADMAALRADLLDPKLGPTLAAFDFPIGLPRFLKATMGCDRFVDALERFGRTEPLKRVLLPADTLDQVSASRPFYPDTQGKKGDKQQGPWRASLGAKGIGDLLRDCERGGDGVPPAGCMFWLTGPKTVGKAAIHGWTEVVRPARAEGAKLWPFDGDLPALAAKSTLVLAESYPADACRQIGVGVKAKGDPVVLKTLAPALVAFAGKRGIALSEDVREAIDTGFAAFGRWCGDAFDAVVGLFAALAVATGESAAAPPLSDDLRHWEGWILGRG